jgi:hypothetical protein
MPQATNRKIQRDRFNCPVGKGTIYNALLDISNATRARAMKVNITESERTKKLQKIIEKNKRHVDIIQERARERTEKSLKELRAFQQVLNNEYKVSNFRTMDKSFRRELIQTPRTARRYKIETRVYYSGFEIKNFKPEIDRKLRQMDPSRTQRIMKKILLEEFKDRSDILIDRNLSEKTFLEMLDNHKNLKQYMYHRKKSVVTFENVDNCTDKEMEGDTTGVQKDKSDVVSEGTKMIDDVIDKVAVVNQN